MCLFRKLGIEISRQNTRFPSTFLSLLGKVILFLALFSSFPNVNHGLCGENSGTGIDEIKTEHSANKKESDINIGAWLVSSVLLLSSEFLRKIFRQRGLAAMERLMGMILTTISVEMFLSGLSMFLNNQQ